MTSRMDPPNYSKEPEGLYRPSSDPEKEAEPEIPAPIASLSDEKPSKRSRFLKHANRHDADEAIKAYEGLEGEVIEIDEATNRRLLRTIDWHIMPLLCAVYGLQYLDKTTLSYASVMGIKKDANLVGNDYQWLGSVFYFGYLFWEYPTNRLLQRLPLAKYSSANIIIWGIVLCCMAGIKNYGGGIAVRFFLGVFESAVTPGFAFFTSQWYTKREQGKRVGIWFSFNGFAQIFGGLVAYGIAVGAKKHGSAIAPWKIVFLVTGLLTSAVGVLFLLVMPDNQLNARWLSPRDRVLAIERIRMNEQGVGNRHFKMYQLKEALLDPLSWMFAFYALVADIPNGGLTNFFSQLIVSFGYTPEQSLLYGTPGGGVEVVALILSAFIADYFGQRVLVSMIGLSVAILGMILIVAVPIAHSWPRLVGYWLTQASPTPFVALLSLISTNVAGYTKKTTVAAMYLIAYCVGNLIGPQVFVPSTAPHYQPAQITILVCWAVCLVDLLLIWLYCRRQNAKKAKQRAEPSYRHVEQQEFLDLTDRENPEFVYAL